MAVARLTETLCTSTRRAVRYTIGHLLLIPPAFFLAVLLVQLWDWEFGPLVTYRHSRAFIGMNSVQIVIVCSDVSVGPEAAIPEDVINQWLAGQLPANNPATQALREHPGLDPWGNPYRCVRNVKLPEGGMQSIGVYSMGRDGVSETNGNDPDDLNSWDRDCSDWYIRDINRRNRISNGTYGAALTPLVYFGLIVCGRLFGLFRAPTYGASPTDRPNSGRSV